MPEQTLNSLFQEQRQIILGIAIMSA